MIKKRELTYFKNIFITLILLFVLMNLIVGCTTPKALVSDPEAPPEVPSGDVDFPPEIPSEDITADTPPSIPGT